MNVPRYVIAGGASLVIHAALLFVAQESKVFAMPAGAESKTVALNFKPQRPTSVQREETVTEPVESEVTPEPEITEAPVEPTPPPVAEPKKVKPKKEAITNKPKPEPKKELVKKTEPKPPVKKQAKKKPVQKKPVEKKVVEKKPEPVKPQPDKKIAEKKVERREHNEAQPQAVNQGLTNIEPVLVTKPTFSARPTPPKYPRQARRRGVEGVATYEIWLDEDGKQVKQALVNSSGALLLDKAALDAIKKWKFSPHTVNGRAIAHRVQVPVRFKLD
ncbi:energy transducer TonB [Vibrio sp. Isolate30]|uniref:energy transducer TonB n=1 Tax=Vibrio sp. Isolate30 TaxID=2908536 RepID=UPI001EFD5332|nr:energy transducer TonB [Vibrio sp. Isolate30]